MALKSTARMAQITPYTVIRTCTRTQATRHKNGCHLRNVWPSVISSIGARVPCTTTSEAASLLEARMSFQRPKLTTLLSYLQPLESWWWRLRLRVPFQPESPQRVTLRPQHHRLNQCFRFCQSIPSVIWNRYPVQLVMAHHIWTNSMDHTPLCVALSLIVSALPPFVMEQRIKSNAFRAAIKMPLVSESCGIQSLQHVEPVNKAWRWTLVHQRN